MPLSTRNTRRSGVKEGIPGSRTYANSPLSEINKDELLRIFDGLHEAIYKRKHCEPKSSWDKQQLYLEVSKLLDTGESSEGDIFDALLDLEATWMKVLRKRRRRGDNELGTGRRSGGIIPSRGTTASGASRAAQTGAGEEDGDSDLIGAARQPDFRKTDCGITGKWQPTLLVPCMIYLDSVYILRLKEKLYASSLDTLRTYIWSGAGVRSPIMK